MLEILETKLKDQSWIDKQDNEFIKALESSVKSVHSLAMKTYIMAELIDKFYEAIIQLFDEENDSATSEPENGNVYPESNTNFSPASQESQG